MAPKGGKGGGGGGKSSSKGISGCSNCTAPLQLQGSDWQSKLTIAWLALAGIVALALLGCLILQRRFKWVRDVKVDKLRNTGYKVAAASLFCAYAFDISDIVLREEAYTTTNLYYITRIFTSFFWRVADLLILCIIYRTIAESSLANLARKLSGLHKLLIVLLALLTIAAFGANTAIYVNLIRGNYSGNTEYKAYDYLSVAYQAIYLVAALLVVLESVTVMLRARSKQTIIMLMIVAPFLFLRSLFNLVIVAINLYSNLSTSTSQVNFFSVRWTCNYITSISDILIFVGVVLIGFFTFRKGASRSGKYVGGTANGGHDAQYVPVSVWANK